MRRVSANYARASSFQWPVLMRPAQVHVGVPPQQQKIGLLLWNSFPRVNQVDGGELKMISSHPGWPSKKVWLTRCRQPSQSGGVHLSFIRCLHFTNTPWYCYLLLEWSMVSGYSVARTCEVAMFWNIDVIRRDWQLQVLVSRLDYHEHYALENNFVFVHFLSFSSLQ